MKPNIFNYAKSELSQDAFFAWLATWGNIDAKEHDPILNKTARKFLHHLLGTDELTITKVKVVMQWNNVDIAITVNDKFFIVIEDKTSSGRHSNQLERYKFQAEEHCKKNKLDYVLIYLKTSSEPKDEQYAIQKLGYKVITREDILTILAYGSEPTNNIFSDYTRYLKGIDANENLFKTQQIKNWINDNTAWKGFYSFLDNNTTYWSSWGVVSNPSGGFLGRWWGFTKVDNHEIYLQIERDKLCIKIANIDRKDEQKTALYKWHNKTLSYAKEIGLNEVVKPKRLKTGKYMTVAVIESQFWLGKPDEIIDTNAVLNKLSMYYSFIENLSKYNNS